LESLPSSRFQPLETLTFPRYHPRGNTHLFQVVIPSGDNHLPPISSTWRRSPPPVIAKWRHSPSPDIIHLESLPSSWYQPLETLTFPMYHPRGDTHLIQIVIAK
jgi:hypothetical protein